ncbi:RNA polymerase sigma factor [Chitinophaga sp. NPDC101104]|uniref:RNA polymerase sigma factor n=1 Tax=Chitinophaga sp. NPDC101104 TaxID=3390561 RepID=UPI003D08E759
MSDTYDHDEELNSHWDAVLLGDAAAYAQVHARLYPLLFRYGLAILGDGDLADDAVQEVFIRIWTKKSAIGPTRNLRAFFFASLRRHCLNQLRSLKTLQVLTAPGPDIEFSPEDIIISEESAAARRNAIAQYLNQLPRRQKEALYLRFYESLSYDEIAAIMKVNYQSVVNLVHKAIAQLRKWMGHLPLWWLLWQVF